MASSENALRIVQASFAQGIAATGSKAAMAGRIIPATGAATFKIGNGAFGGIGSTLSRTATSQSNSDYFTFESDHSMLHKVLKHTVPVATTRTDYAFEQAGIQLAQAAVATMDKLFFDGLEGLFAAAHPRAGAGAGQVGAAKKYLDTSLKFLNGEAGEGTQDNLITSALDEAALNTAIKLLLQYRSDRGIPLHLGTNGGLVLVVAPKNAQVAHELVVSQLSGADMASNFVKNLVSDVVVFPFTTDSNDWFLIDKANAPVGIALESDPTARISTTTDGLFYELVSEVSCVFFKSPYEYGIVGSNV